MIAVLDTNVWVSGIINGLGPPGRIIALWRNDYFKVVISPLLIGELERALTYPRVRAAIQRPEEEVHSFVAELARIAVSLETPNLDVSRDPDDNRFLEAAIAGDADFLVTGDRDLLTLEEHEGIAIVTPARFLAILETTAQP